MLAVPPQCANAKMRLKTGVMLTVASDRRPYSTARAVHRRSGQPSTSSADVAAARSQAWPRVGHRGPLHATPLRVRGTPAASRFAPLSTAPSGWATR